MLALRAMYLPPLAAVLLLAEVSAAGSPMASVHGSPPTPPCSQVIPNEPEGTPGQMQPSAGENHLAWRLRNWRTPVTRQGKWVGVVARDTKDPSARAKYFPGLAPGKSGCVYFADTATVTSTARPALAGLYGEGDTLLHTYRAAIICDGGHPHSPPPSPVEADPAEQCPQGTEGAILISPPDPSLPGIILRFEVGTNGFEGTIRDSLKTQRALLSADMLNAFFSKGPWFPCSETGCCRPI